MIIVDTHNKTFDEYIGSLSKKARKNYAYVKKHNQDLIYEELPFVRDVVEEFMCLWECQLIRGEYRRWAFDVGHIEDLARHGRIRVFGARRGKERVSLHFIQSHDGFWECHPPMFDKGFGEERYLAKFMWFNLFKYGCENGLGIFELGGGIDSSWREMIKRRDEFPNPAYKWMYVPEEVKNNPDTQPDYEMIIEGQQRWMHLKN